jgi:hypothetical protein
VAACALTTVNPSPALQIRKHVGVRHNAATPTGLKSEASIRIQSRNNDGESDYFGRNHETAGCSIVDLVAAEVHVYVDGEAVNKILQRA